ncbi:MAG: 2-succinyl-5-enolpyruvyl-6-hydroxy-3-cyclohexene-1-carboxylic-acid synthase [Flavobacteriales bacterium Tduv]
MYSNKKIIQSLGEILKVKGIHHMVISPGSRNAPMILQFTQQQVFKTYSIVDERCAAFFALGMAQSLKNPVAINCTSGSALTNYHPAITEAFYQDIPLIIITADRPKEFIDLFEGQTIRQENFFQAHTVKSVQLTEDEIEKGLWHNERLINEALNEALLKQKPVHINVPLSEPLYDTINRLQTQPKIIDIPGTTPLIDKKTLENHKKIWNWSKKKMILVGQNNPSQRLKKALEDLTQDPSIIILTETLANVHHRNFIPHIDRMIFPMKEQEWNNFQPEILLTVGKNIISKKIKDLLKITSYLHHWHVEPIREHNPDTYQHLTSHWITSPEDLLEKLQGKTNKNSDYGKKWTKLKDYRQKKHDLFLKDVKFSDLKVFNQILKKIPPYTNLQLGNSTIIRYQQLFDQKSSVTSHCNRGTAGIDGLVSTAIGAAVTSNRPVTLIIGDVSFFYDSNALWNKYTPHNFRIILINNGGGNIFRFIPGPSSSPALEDYFETKHSLTAQHLCQTYRWEYYQADDTATLSKNLESFWNISKSPRLLEINTRDQKNEHILKKYFEFIN